MYVYEKGQRFACKATSAETQMGMTNPMRRTNAPSINAILSQFESPV